MTVRCWREFGGTDAAWDAVARGLPGASVFQSAAWADHRRSDGWSPRRWVAGDWGAVQTLVLRRWGITVAWAPAGPLFDGTNVGAEDARSLATGLFESLRARSGPTYARIDPPIPTGSTLAAALGEAWARPAVRLNTGMTVLLELTADATALRARMSKHHRAEVRRGRECSISWTVGNGPADVEALTGLHGEMTRRKRIATAPQAQRHAIASLCSHFGDGALILVGSKGDVPITACLALIFADRAFFHTAATGAAGLACGASYAAVEELAGTLARRGVRELDLGGLDDRGPMAGVARFKTGFGGRVIERTGEWHRAAPSALGQLVDGAAWLRQRIRS